MDNLIIHVRPSFEEEGYMYDIYDCQPEEIEEADSIDGGLCTGSFLDAVDMATEQAKVIIKARHGNK